MKPRRTEILLVLALVFHLQWFFGNVYEEILTPNQIVATTEQVNAYNRFFSLTQPYFYYVPLTQIGFLITLFLAVRPGEVLRAQRRSLRLAAGASALATGLTAYIVTQYNLKMFFGPVDHLGDRIHQLYLEWALLNLARIVLTGAAIAFLFLAYRKALLAGGRQAHAV